MGITKNLNNLIAFFSIIRQFPLRSISLMENIFLLGHVLLRVKRVLVQGNIKNIYRQVLPTNHLLNSFFNWFNQTIFIYNVIQKSSNMIFSILLHSARTRLFPLYWFAIASLLLNNFLLFYYFYFYSLPKQYTCSILILYSSFQSKPSYFYLWFSYFSSLN